MRIKKVIAVLSCILLSACSSNQLPEATLIDQTIVISDMMEMKFTDLSIMDEVGPPTPSGYYHHFEQHEGYVYLCQRGTIKNTSSIQYNIKKMKLSLIEHDLEGTIILLNSDGSRFIDAINAGETNEFYIVFLIKKEDLEEKFQDQIRMDFQHQFMKESDSYDYSYMKNIEVNT